MEHAKKNMILCDPAFIRRSINLPPPLVEHHPCYNEYVEILQQGVVQDLGALHAADFTRFRFEYLRNEQMVTSAKALLAATFRNKSLALVATQASIAKLEAAAKVQSYAVDEYIKTKAKLTLLTKEIGNIVTLLDGRKCPLCAENFTDKVTRVKTRCCSVRCCQSCITQWVDHDGRCPKCCVTIQKLDLVEDTAPLPASPPKKRKHLYRDKMEELGHIMEAEQKRENFRILIFSDYGGTLLRVRDILTEQKLAYAEIEGNQITMTRAIDDFRSGKRPVLVIDSQQYGAGMNMEMTTAVIIMHKTERESQIVGRAQRLGRTDRLHVHHLLYKNE